MGVRGLHSWLRHRKDAGEDVRLRSGSAERVRVVIDGHSLCYHMYYNTPGLDVALAGSYPAFAEAIARFFRTIADCGVDAVVFLDGAVEAIKRATAFKRGADAARRAARLVDGAGAADGGGAGSVLPILALDVFRYGLVEGGVRVEQTAGEADLAIARFAADPANGVFCVWSNDSDFYVFPDLPGYAPLETVSHDPTTGTLNMVVYRPARTAAALGACPEVLPLLACLVGNDFLDDTVARRAYGALLTASEAGRTGWGLLEALAKWAARVSAAAGFDGPAARAAGLAEVRASRLAADPGHMAAFESAVAKYRSAAGPDPEADELAAGAARAFGPAFLDEYRRGLHSADLVSIASRREIWLTPLVEDYSRPSAYAAFAPARRRLYRWILPGEGSVAECRRSGGEFGPHPVPLQGGGEGGIRELRGRPRAERLAALLDAFGAGHMASLAGEGWQAPFVAAVALRGAVAPGLGAAAPDRQGALRGYEVEALLAACCGAEGPEAGEGPLAGRQTARRAFLHAAAHLQAGVAHALLLNEALGLPLGPPPAALLPFHGPAAFAWYEAARGSPEGARRAREACPEPLRAAVLRGALLPPPARAPPAPAPAPAPSKKRPSASAANPFGPLGDEAA